MAHHPILIRNITHLTDARYFAAMSVDWMSLQLTHDPATFLRWHSLREWVQGIRLVAEIDASDEMLLAKTMIDAAPDALLLSKPTDVVLPGEVPLFFDVVSVPTPALPDSGHLIFPFVAGQSWPSLDPNHLFLQADWTESLISTLIQSGYQGGFCLMGGEEEVTGIRDYELIDEIIQMIRE